MDNTHLSFAERASVLDSEDPLKEFKKRFFTGSDNLIYLDGNSLGMMPLESAEVAKKLLDREWGERLIRSWNENWWEMPERISGKLAPIIGAGKDEVIICDSTSVNLYKLVSAALKMRPGRKKIVSDELNFPSDLYIIQGVIDHIGQGHKLALVESGDNMTIGTDKLERAIDEETALVVLTLVSFRSAFMYDMEQITNIAHSKGALVIWDLCHAAGAVEIELSHCKADMAVGCTYKYLNGGPGSPGFMYVNKEIIKNVISPVWGWIGEKNPFGFSLKYRPADGVKRYMTGSPNILSLCPLEPSLEIIGEAGIKRIREKSVQMTSFLTEMFTELLESAGFSLGSPPGANDRGSHISLKHPEAFRISRALLDPQEGDITIIPDFRPDDNLRLGLVPLYNSFSDIVKTVSELVRITRDKIYMNYDLTTDKVT